MPFYGGGGGRGGGRDFGGRDEPVDRNSEQFRKLFIGGLNYDTDNKSLRAYFETWGEIVDCIVMHDPNTKRSRGFGFVTYKEADSVDQVQKNRPHVIDNREVETKRAMPRDETGSQEAVKKMFVGGIRDDTTEDMVREVFAEFGNITQAEMINDKATGKTRGFCFVSFDDPDSVDKTVLIKRHKLNGRMVEVKKAVSKQEINNKSGPSNRGGPPPRGGQGDFGGYGSGGGGGGGYNQGGYGGGQGGGYSGGGGGYGGGGGGYGPGGGGGYGGGHGGGWNSGGGGGGNFGQGYENSYSGGPTRGGGGGGYSQRGQGPYGGGYGSGGGGGYGGGGGGGYSGGGGGGYNSGGGGGYSGGGGGGYNSGGGGGGYNSGGGGYNSGGGYGRR